MFTESMRTGIKMVNTGMRNGRVGTTMKETSKANILRKHQVHQVSQVLEWLAKFEEMRV